MWRGSDAQAAHAQSSGSASATRQNAVATGPTSDRRTQMAEEAMQKAVAAGAKYHKVDKTPWQKAMMPIYTNWAPKVGGMELIKAVQDTP
jgi:hypothetical protein